MIHSPTRFRSLRASLRPRAFTLIEMMVVVAMIALIVAAMAPMVFSTLVSTRLTSAGESLASQISLARQMAVSGNQSVEIRFYQYEDPEYPGTKAAYKAVAIMRASGTGTAYGATVKAQLTDTFYLPSGIVVGESSDASPILSSGSIPSQADGERIIKRSDSARYKAFKINPDGSTNLEQLMGGGFHPNLAYITLGEERALTDSQTIPKNFFAIQIDPTTGRTSSYRP